MDQPHGDQIAYVRGQMSGIKDFKPSKLSPKTAESPQHSAIRYA
jgi:hypothetical protein